MQRMEIASNPHNGSVLMDVVIREWSGLYTTVVADKTGGARSVGIDTTVRVSFQRG